MVEVKIFKLEFGEKAMARVRGKIVRFLGIRYLEGEGMCLFAECLDEVGEVEWGIYEVGEERKIERSWIYLGRGVYPAGSIAKTEVGMNYYGVLL